MKKKILVWSRGLQSTLHSQNMFGRHCLNKGVQHIMFLVDKLAIEDLGHCGLKLTISIHQART
jgi:hypothetical protein